MVWRGGDGVAMVVDASMGVVAMRAPRLGMRCSADHATLQQRLPLALHPRAQAHPVLPRYPRRAGPGLGVDAALFD